MRPLQESLWVGLGAAVGANLRWWLGVWTRAAAQPFPYTTMAINVVGSLVLGLFMGFSQGRDLGWQPRLLLAVGLCGGFTTFSAFSYETLSLMQERTWRLALAYALLSVVLCTAACAAGVAVGRSR